MNQTQTKLDRRDLKSIEVVSPKVSDKYVPIFTSEIIEILEPEFEFIEGFKPMGSSSVHYAELGYGDEIIRIYNSYDRRLALGMSLVKDVIIDLGVNRLIHQGQNAENFMQNLKENKHLILEAVEYAKKIDTYLGSYKITPEMAHDIDEIVFRTIINKEGFQSYINYIDILVPNISIKSFIDQTLSKFIEGDYTYIVSGKKRKGFKKTSEFFKIRLQRQIMDFIQDKYVEYIL